MATPHRESLVFDHAGTSLQSHARKCGFVNIPTTKEGDARDEEAAEHLVAAINWNVAFLHINTKPWQKLTSQLAAPFVIVRFSNEGFPPKRPEGLKALCLRCRKKISEIGEPDLNALKNVLADAGSIESIRRGVIPPSIQHMLTFEEPHRLRTFHILLQGVLACWSSDPGNSHQKDALRLLKIDSIPPLPHQKFTQLATFSAGLGLAGDAAVTAESKEALKQQIARELGCETLQAVPAIDELVSHICDADRNSQVSPEFVLCGFQAIDTFLSKS